MLHKHGVRNVTVIPNGIDTLPLAELEVKSLTLPLRLIAVSRLEPNKRVEHAIKALQILVQRGIEATLTIVGTGEAEPNLRHSARELGVEPRVTFTGLVSEQQKNEHLQRAHLLIHTSIREGWGLNVIEANAMGTPAIVYPVGGLVDSTIHKQTGLVTTTEAPGVVVDALASLLKAPENYAAYRMNAWERSKTFQWNRVLPKACDWLEQQARTQRRP
jgi:glycosyltransferase involved in cell wall biosynthesis